MTTDNKKDLQFIDAASFDDSDTIERLIAEGVDVNVVDEEGRTALMWAAIEGYTEATKVLLNAGADADVKDRNGDTALMHAGTPSDCDRHVLKEIYEIVELTKILIDAGADINAKNNCGTTALHHATSNKQAQLVKMLLDAGANIGGEMVINTATPEIAYLLRRKHEKHAPTNHKDTSLIQAVVDDNTAEVKRLISEGADVNAMNDNFSTALLIAAYNHEIAHILVNAGAFVEARDTDGWTAFMRAASAGNVKSAKMLLDAGANINAEDNRYCTAFMHAAGSGHADMVKILIDKGVNINAEVISSGTALMQAAEGGHADVIRTLIDAGADVNAKNDLSGTALIQAMEGYGFFVIIAEDTSLETAVIHAAESNYANIASMLISAGADVNAAAPTFGTTALIEAANSGSSKLTGILLNVGADMSMSNISEMTALMCAKEKRHAGVIEILLGSGADC